MSDIDFDELDAAVASVLNKDGTPIAPPAANAAPTPAATPVAPAVQTTGATMPAQPDPSKAPAANAADLHKPAPVAPRGRFLDMVHPSGDMARPAAPRPLTAPAKPAVAPAAAPVFATEPVISPVVPAAQAPVASPALVVPSAPVVSAPQAAPAGTPASALNAATPATPPVTGKAPAGEDFFAASPDDSAPHAAPNVTPVASPFIPDAKVEKRPLGGSAADAPVFAPTPVDPPDAAIHAALSKIESEDNAVHDTPEATPPTAASTPVATPIGSDAAMLLADDKPSPAMASETRPDRIVQPLSVVEAPAFFTHKAPAPVEAEPVKHGKGTLIWVTVAVAILLIGFGVGASLFFTVLR